MPSPARNQSPNLEGEGRELQPNETVRAVKKVFTNPIEGFISLAKRVFHAGKSVFNKAEEYKFFRPLYIIVRVIQVALAIGAGVAFIGIAIALLPSSLIAQGLMSLSRGLGNLITAGAYAESTKRAQGKFSQDLESMLNEPGRMEHAKSAWIKSMRTAAKAMADLEEDEAACEAMSDEDILAAQHMEFTKNNIQQIRMLISEHGSLSLKVTIINMKDEDFTNAFFDTLPEQIRAAYKPKTIEDSIKQVNKALCMIELATKQPNRVVTSLKVLYNSLTRPLPGGAKNIYAIPVRFVQGLLSLGVVLPVMIVSEAVAAAQGIASLAVLGVPSLAFITAFVALNIPLYIKDGIKGLWNLCCCRKGPRDRIEIEESAAKPMEELLSRRTPEISPGLAAFGRRNSRETFEAETAHHQGPAAIGRSYTPVNTGIDQRFLEPSCVRSQSF